MSYASELADYIDAQLPAFTINSNLFDFILPDGDDSDDECVAVRETGGTDDQQSPLSKVTFQIMSRGEKNDNVSPDDNLKAIHNLLLFGNRVGDESIRTAFSTSTWRWHSILSIARPQFLQFDEMDRPVFVWNFEAVVTPL